jgi:hypothetical protein
MKKAVVVHGADTAVEVNERWLDLESQGGVRLTSEDPAHPIAAALHDGAAGWKAAQGGPQTIWIHFDAPQAIREVHLRFEATEQRTQEFAVLWSADGGVTYREMVRQQFNFSPRGAMAEAENYFPDLAGVTDLKLNITPDISGGQCRATLRALRIR